MHVCESFWAVRQPSAWLAGYVLFLNCGYLVTLWFTIGGVFDMKYLPHRFRGRAVDAHDNGCLETADYTMTEVVR